jgi:antitoxin component of MazEF toxin-antitoxin module
MERKTVKLNRAGGSRAAVLPAAWLERAGIRDEAVLTETDAGILVASPSAGKRSLESQPSFAKFLAFLTEDALHHPDQLGDIGELFAHDDELLEGVEPDDDE